MACLGAFSLLPRPETARATGAGNGKSISGRLWAWVPWRLGVIAVGVGPEGMVGEEGFEPTTNCV